MMRRGSMSKKWVGTNPADIRPNNINAPVKKYFQEIKPLLFLERAFGELPYSFNDEGFAPFKLVSFPVFYTIVFILVDYVWTINTMCTIGKEKIIKSSSYDETLFWSSLGFFLLLNFTTPITKWFGIRKFVHHIRSWQDFQNNHLDLELKANLFVKLKIVSIIILPSSTIVIYIQCYLLTELPAFVMVPFIIAFVQTAVTISHWNSILYELRAASGDLLRKMIKDGCRETPTYRRTWLELSQLVSGVGESLGLTGLVVVNIFFATSILTSYAFLTSIFASGSSSKHFWGLLINTSLNLFFNFYICNAAHLTTKMVGPEFTAKVLALDLNHLSQDEKNEMSLLLQTISSNPPTVEYLGFVTVNRQLFVSLISNAVTYMVVLVQFKASSPVNSQ